MLYIDHKAHDGADRTHLASLLYNTIWEKFRNETALDAEKDILATSVVFNMFLKPALYSHGK